MKHDRHPRRARRARLPVLATAIALGSGLILPAGSAPAQEVRTVRPGADLVRESESVLHMVGNETLSRPGLDGVAAWRVDVGFPDGRELVYWLDPASRRLVWGRGEDAGGRTLIIHPPERPPSRL